MKWEVDTAHFQSTCQSVVDISRKIVDVTVGAVSWTSYYFHGTSYLYDKQSWLARLRNVAGIFSEMNSELAISRKDRYFFPMKKNGSFWERNKIMKSLYSPPLWTYWTTSQWLLFWWICEAINECDVWILHNKICQHLEVMHSWMNQYFLHDKCLQNIPSSCRISTWILT